LKKTVIIVHNIYFSSFKLNESLDKILRLQNKTITLKTKCCCEKNKQKGMFINL